jgi:hypothetical protein
VIPVGWPPDEAPVVEETTVGAGTVVGAAVVGATVVGDMVVGASVVVAFVVVAFVVVAFVVFPRRTLALLAVFDFAGAFVAAVLNCVLTEEARGAPGAATEVAADSMATKPKTTASVVENRRQDLTAKTVPGRR